MRFRQVSSPLLIRDVHVSSDPGDVVVKHVRERTHRMEPSPRTMGGKIARVKEFAWHVSAFREVSTSYRIPSVKMKRRGGSVGGFRSHNQPGERSPPIYLNRIPIHQVCFRLRQMGLLLAVLEQLTSDTILPSEQMFCSCTDLKQACSLHSVLLKFRSGFAKNSHANSCD